MSELLIELFSEEMPPKLQINARRQLDKLLRENLSNLNINLPNNETFCLHFETCIRRCQKRSTNPRTSSQAGSWMQKQMREEEAGIFHANRFFPFFQEAE